jgi:hypothetical protein
VLTFNELQGIISQKIVLDLQAGSGSSLFGSGGCCAWAAGSSEIVRLFKQAEGTRLLLCWRPAGQGKAQVVRFSGSLRCLSGVPARSSSSVENFLPSSHTSSVGRCSTSCSPDLPFFAFYFLFSIGVPYSLPLFHLHTHSNSCFITHAES